MPRLKSNQPCPIHRGSRTCCGRSQEIPRAVAGKPKYRIIGAGVREYPDGHIERAPAALRAVKDHLLHLGETCIACGKPFTDYGDVELAHRKSKGMAGWKRDDSMPNLVLAHKSMNRAQGSLDLDIYLREYWKPEHCTG